MFFIYKRNFFYDVNVNQLSKLAKDQNRFSRSYIEVYKIVERRVKSNDKTPFHHEILIFC